MNLGRYAHFYPGQIRFCRGEGTPSSITAEEIARMHEYHILLCPVFNVWVGSSDLPDAKSLLAGHIEAASAGCTSTDIYVIKLFSADRFSDYPRVVNGNEIHLRPNDLVFEVGPVSLCLA